MLVPVGAKGLFRDVSQTAWYYSAVAQAYDQGLMVGTGNAHFSPNGTMTRAMFVTVLGRLSQVEAEDYQDADTFTDVPSGQWYSGYVQWAYETGITQGTSETTFSPNAPVEREQIAAFLARYLTALGYLEADSSAPEPETPETPEETLPVVAEEPIQESAPVETDAPAAEETPAETESPAESEPPAETVSPAEPDANTGIALASLAEDSAVAEGYGDMEDASSWAVESILTMQELGLLIGDNNGNFNPKSQATRAEGATIFVRLNKYLQGEDLTIDPADNPVVDSYPIVDNPLVSYDKLAQAADTYGLAPDSPAEEALYSINTVYADQLTASQKTGVVVFFFEGVGSSDDPSERLNAMCVVVKNGNIVYLNRNSTTLADYPFLPRKNDGVDVPTLLSGIYTFTTINHKGSYAALRVRNDKVLRFHDQNTYYLSVSEDESIHVHRRAKDGLSPLNENWANSSGCLMVGVSGTAADGEYARFAQAVGIIESYEKGNAGFSTQVTGTLVVDRTYAASYLRAIGYSDEAIALIG
jgi:hypothetical protein